MDRRQEASPPRSQQGRIWHRRHIGRLRDGSVLALTRPPSSSLHHRSFRESPCGNTFISRQLCVRELFNTGVTAVYVLGNSGAQLQPPHQRLDRVAEPVVSPVGRELEHGQSQVLEVRDGHKYLLFLMPN